MTDRELMQMALEELEELADVGYGSKTVLQALRDRLAQPEPDDLTAAYMSGLHDGKKKREWVGLTDEEIDNFALDGEGWFSGSLLETVREIDAKLKEKNTGAHGLS